MNRYRLLMMGTTLILAVPRTRNRPRPARMLRQGRIGSRGRRLGICRNAAEGADREA